MSINELWAFRRHAAFPLLGTKRNVCVSWMPIALSVAFTFVEHTKGARAIGAKSN